jgi:hypothetical protein
MTFVTTATGQRHIELAAAMQESFRRHGWPELIVATGDDYPEYNDLWKGRGLKTRWANFLPEDCAGPVAFVDCDCEAIGPYLGDPHIPDGGMAGIVLSRLKLPTGGRMNFMASTILFLPDRQQAIEVCDEWHANLILDKRRHSDEPALHRATKYRPATQTGWFKMPMENLIHLAATHPV